MTETAYLGATLIDGTGAAPLPDSAVVVRGDRIAWTGRAGDLAPAEGRHTVDLAGRYLIPGLLDANVHLFSDILPDILLRFAPGDYDGAILEAAQVALRAGVTTVFDTWGPLDALKRVRDRAASGEVAASRIFCAGNIIGMDGPLSADQIPLDGLLSRDTVAAVNWEWERGVGRDLLWLSSGDVREGVREYIASSGIDFVKYSSSAHVESRYIAFSSDAQRVICEEAHAAGLTAQACTQAPEALRMAIDAGVDLLQHGDITGPRPMPAETVRLIAERQLPCVAFLSTERHVCSTPELHFGRRWRDEMVAKDENDRNLIAAKAKLLLANDMGVYSRATRNNPAMAGHFAVEDAPRDLGSAHLLWFKAALERGMEPMDVLLSATRNIAEGYHRSDELGTVEAGKLADFVVLEADPLEDHEHYARVVDVIKDGQVVDRERLPELRVLTEA
jgi:imidazolonepropionase-like amidohydrolase